MMLRPKLRQLFCHCLKHQTQVGPRNAFAQLVLSLPFPIRQDSQTRAVRVQLSSLSWYNSLDTIVFFLTLSELQKHTGRTPSHQAALSQWRWYLSPPTSTSFFVIPSLVSVFHVILWLWPVSVSPLSALGMQALVFLCVCLCVRCVFVCICSVCVYPPTP